MVGDMTDFVQSHIVLACDAGEISIFQLLLGNIGIEGLLHMDVAKGSVDNILLAVENISAADSFADTEGGGMAKHQICHFSSAVLAAHAGQHDGGTTLLHADVDGVDVKSTAVHQQFLNECDVFAGHVVEVAAQFGNFVGSAFGFADADADTVGCLKVLVAHAVAVLADLHDGHFTKAGGKVLQQSGTGGGAELAADLAVIDGNTAQNVSGCRSGNGKNAVCTANHTAADVDGGDDNLFCTDGFHQHADAGNVCDCIHGANFVEVDFIHGLAMNMAFGLSDQLVNIDDIGLDLVGNGKLFNNSADAVHTVVMMVTVCTVAVAMVMVMAVVMIVVVAVVMVAVIVIVVMIVVMVVLMIVAAAGAVFTMIVIVVMTVVVIMVVVVVMVMIVVVTVVVVVVMVMVVAVIVVMVVVVVVTVVVTVDIVAQFFFAVNGNGNMGAGDAALDSGLHFSLDTGDAQRIHLFNKCLRIGMQLQQSGHQHIAGSAHCAIDIQSLHNSKYYLSWPVSACSVKWWDERGVCA